MRAARTYAEMERYFNNRGLEAQFWQREADYMLELIVKPDLRSVRVPLCLTKLRTSTEPSPWFNWWLSRLVRRIHGSKLFKWLRLKWLSDLAFAHSLNVTYESEKLPGELLEKIFTMRSYLEYKGLNPTKVLMGERAEFQVKQEFYHTWPVTFDVPGRSQVCGLEVEISPFLAEDQVLVC